VFQAVKFYFTIMNKSSTFHSKSRNLFKKKEGFIACQCYASAMIYNEILGIGSPVLEVSLFFSYYGIVACDVTSKISDGTINFDSKRVT
jgi:hypothetical protein